MQIPEINEIAFMQLSVPQTSVPNENTLTLNGMRRFSANTESIKYAYLTYVRPILEYSRPVWASLALGTVYLCQELESVQKRAVSIILGCRDIPHEKALEVLEIPSLQSWYETLVRKLNRIMFFFKFLRSFKTLEMNYGLHLFHISFLNIKFY